MRESRFTEAQIIGRKTLVQRAKSGDLHVSQHATWGMSVKTCFKKGLNMPDRVSGKFAFRAFLCVSAFALSGCVEPGTWTGIANGAGVATSSPPPRTRAPDIMGDYYANQARRADREILRKNSPVCRTSPDLLIC
jgi:hypothetical protein